MHVRREDFDVVMAGLTATMNVDGIFITMPHKFTVFGHCATVSDRSQLLRVVNVLRRNPDGAWHGDMLDGLSFVKAQEEQGALVEGSRVLLVGAGGAGRAIAIALLEAGIRELHVHDTDEARVVALLGLLRGLGYGQVFAGPPDPTGCDVVINATPMGMDEGDPLPVDPAMLASSMFVGDVVAGHGITPFIRAAQGAGCRTAGGDDMVVAGLNLLVDFMLGSSQWD